MASMRLASTPMRPHVFVGRSGRPARRSKMARRAPCAAETIAVSDDTAQLRAALKELESVHTNLTPEDLKARIETIEMLSQGLGTNKADPALLQGHFKPYALSGPLKKNVSPENSGLTLGALSFSAVQPADLKVSFNPTARQRCLWRGQKGGLQTHIIPSCVSINGLQAVSEAVMDWTVDPDNPQRVLFSSREVVVTPEFEEGRQAEQLEQWLALLGPANAANVVDHSTGQITAAVTKTVSIYLDCLVAIPGWNMFRSANGSCTLLRGAQGPFVE